MELAYPESDGDGYGGDYFLGGEGNSVVWERDGSSSGSSSGFGGGGKGVVSTALPMNVSLTSYVYASRTTLCDIMCTTNTVCSYTVPQEARSVKDTVVRTPYKPKLRTLSFTKAETPWQKFKLRDAKANRNELLHKERDEYMEKLRAEKKAKDWYEFVCAVRIQALWRGYRCHLRPRPGAKPKPKFVRKPKIKQRVTQHEMQDELCHLASRLALKPILGLSLESRAKANRRRKKFELAAALTLQRFMRCMVAKILAKRRMRAIRDLKIFKGAKIITRFFKSLKLLTFKRRMIFSKQCDAVVVIQNAARKFLSYNRVRKLKRLRVRLKRATMAAIIIQRNMKVMRHVRAKRKQVLFDAAYSRIEEPLFDELLSFAVLDANQDALESHLVEKAVEQIELQLTIEVLESVAVEAEKLHIEDQVRLLAELAAKMEQERIALEMEMARRAVEEAERARLEEEARVEAEFLEQRRLEEERVERARVAEENRKRALEEKARKMREEMEQKRRQAELEAEERAKFSIPGKEDVGVLRYQTKKLREKVDEAISSGATTSSIQQQQQQEMIHSLAVDLVTRIIVSTTPPLDQGKKITSPEHSLADSFVTSLFPKPPPPQIFQNEQEGVEKHLAVAMVAQIVQKAATRPTTTPISREEVVRAVVQDIIGHALSNTTTTPVVTKR